MSNRDKELKESFISLFNTKLHETASTYFDRKKDPMVEDMTFSDEELTEIELEVRKALYTGEHEDDSTET